MDREDGHVVREQPGPVPVEPPAETEVVSR